MAFLHTRKTRKTPLWEKKQQLHYLIVISRGLWLEENFDFVYMKNK